MHWTREAIDARVAKLAEEHEGAAFVEAVVEFGDQLDDEERSVLGEALVRYADRRGEIRHALIEETRRPRFFRRMYELLENPTRRRR